MTDTNLPEPDRQAFEHRMLDFGWRNFEGSISGSPPCWHYDDAGLNSRWIGWREAVLLNATVPDATVPDVMVLVPVDALKRWRDAFAEELSAWDIDPPLHHVQTSHDEIEAMLSAAPAAPQPAQASDDGMPASSDERHLRRLLAAKVAMPNTYFDDGEAHGAEHGIQIDFMREPVAHIDAKLRALNVARLEVAAPQPAQPAQQTCNCRWVGDVQVQQCTLHQAHVEAIHEWAERAKAAEAKLKAQQPLTDEQINDVMRKALGYGLSPTRDELKFIRAIEKAHGIGVKP